MDAQGVALLALMSCVLLATLLGRQRLGRLRDLVASRVSRLRPARPSPPVGRPIEEIASDVFRLGARFRYDRAGASFARFEGCRQAYDRVLAEACHALGVEHLLAVIPPGPELDDERGRVEAALDRAGMRLDDAA